MSEELKPCPFCGGAASLALCGFGTARVTCMDCGSEGQYSPSREDAISAWNRSHPPIPAEVGRRAMERLEHISRRLQMDIDDGSSPDQLSMEDLVRMAAKSITELQQYLPAQEQGEKERI